MRIKNVKNKVGPPFRETSVNLLYDTGFDLRSDVIEYAIQLGVVTESSKSWFDFKGERLRKKDLTEDPVFDIIKIEAMKARDLYLTKNQEEA
jgi:hypothetical protein